MAGTKITEEKIVEINELYLKIKTYAGVSRALGGSPSPTTVKKYIIPNYVPKSEIVFEKFEYKLPTIAKEDFEGIDWRKELQLSPKEKEEIQELWKELTL